MGYAETGTNEPNTGLGYQGQSMFGQVNFIPAETLAKLVVPLSMRDRVLLIIAMAGFASMTIALTVALIYVSFKKNDPQYLSAALVTAILVTFGLAFIFVAGPIEKTRQIMRAVTRQAPPAPAADQSQVNVNVGADAAVPAPVVADVKEVKADTKAIRKKVKA